MDLHQRLFQYQEFKGIMIGLIRQACAAWVRQSLCVGGALTATPTKGRRMQERGSKRWRASQQITRSCILLHYTRELLYSSSRVSLVTLRWSDYNYVWNKEGGCYVQ
jgi:hypothetical protein